jgi:tetratricopeptide (TPR) repeat protein/predicted Ser/Thr protein kinase
MHAGGPDLPVPDDAATERLERPPTFPPTGVGPGPRAENEARLGRRIGPYRLQRLLGHGGMGAVYLATRADGEFEREVALKLIRMGGEDELSVRRFERERRILSRLEHPAIARLYDGGVDEQTGAPWFAMERIEGENLAKWCAARQLPLRERVRLVMAIGQAVQYAHQQLVIHRDLKPSNIMVDASGAPHVLDFGIAALLDESEADRTSPRTAIHTPEYAAPEQIEGAPISAATDVYTLGVILFELLTGERPFDAEGRSAFELQRAVLEAATPALTTRLPGDPERLAQQAAERGATPAQWRRVLRGDLDAIVQHALEKQPQRRYPSMAALVDDLQAWLDGRPVRAARAGWLYRGGKFVRRHRLALATVASVFALLAVATGLSLLQARKARLEAERAEASKQFLASLFQQARPGVGGDTLSAQQLLDEGRVRLEQEMRGQPRLAGELLNTIGNAYAHLGDYAQARSQLERALQQLPAEGETLRPRLDVLVDLVDLCSHQDRREEGERYAAEALQLLAQLREAAASPLAWLRGRDTSNPTYYFGDAAQTLDSRAEDLDLARARLLDLRGASGEAIALREAVAQARDARPNEHPTRIRTAQNDLALALMQASRYEEAVARFERLLRDNEREHGAGHASSITVRHNLALTLRRLDRLGEAERIERDNLAVAERALPASHPMQAYVANTLASILRQQGRYAEAQPLYVRARAVFDGQPEADPGMLATVHLTESQNRLAMFDAEGAEASLAAAERTWREAFGAEFPRRASVALQRAALALQRGDEAAAGAALQAADALLVSNAGVDPRDRPRRVLLGAEWRRLRNEADTAAQELDAAWPQWQQDWPAPHVEQVAWALARAQLALDRGEIDAAQQHLALAQDQQTRRHAAELPELRLLQARLACAQRRFEACAAAAARAEEGFAAYLASDAWPRRLARAWAACATSRGPRATSAANAAHAPDVAALEAACRR